MFMPNVNCTITQETGYDLYGQPVLGATQRARCGIVKLDVQEQKTSVRADSSASRGNAQEITADARLLFQPIYRVAINDVVTVAGTKLKVISVEPHYSVNGKLDHNQVDCMAYGD